MGLYEQEYRNRAEHGFVTWLLRISGLRSSIIGHATPNSNNSGITQQHYRTRNPQQQQFWRVMVDSQCILANGEVLPEFRPRPILSPNINYPIKSTANEKRQYIK
jgi:hypothetical protein